MKNDIGNATNCAIIMICRMRFVSNLPGTMALNQDECHGWA